MTLIVDPDRYAGTLRINLRNSHNHDIKSINF